ncbi:MAG: hypothetical protein KJ732_02815 [Candidatus Margulisbacteria bacterium]|nr:hypothetical protein [Candidatus Margulisiibacteriota bacterium]
MKHLIFLMIFMVLALGCMGMQSAGAQRDLYYEKAIYTDEYGLSIYPEYPPTIGQTVTLRLRTFNPAFKVTLISDRDEIIPMTFRQGHWWGKFKIPDDYQEGGHFFTVWIRYVVFDPRGFRPTWAKSVVWYKAFTKEQELSGPAPGTALPLPPDISPEMEENLPEPVTGEAIMLKVISPEAAPLMIKGSQSITFKSRTLQGSKEGYTPGTLQTREEALRVNISGRAADTDIEASLYRTSALGVSQISEQQDEISILMRRGSTEAYLGDFNGELTETEFARLEQVLQGGRIKGDYNNWGFAALYSSPKGQAKYLRTYGNGTQGPYQLADAPVVIDSEKVRLDGVLQKRGDDYTIDYQAGTVNFIKKIIDSRSIIEARYDYRQTVYQHATYGLRAFVKPWPYLKLGATYLDDSDSLGGAAVIRSSMSQEAIDPQSHYVVGADASLVSENLSAQGEVAYSAKKLDLLSASGTQEAGRAAKINLSSALGPFGLTAQVKRVGPKFQAIADVDPRQDVWEYGGGLSFRPGSFFGSKGDYAYQKYTQGGIIYENLYKTVKAQLSPEKFPSLEYDFSQTDESNDPVSGSLIRRVITRNSVETIHQAGFLSSSLKGTLEEWLRHSPSQEATNYKKLNFGLATTGLEQVTFSSNIELEDRQEPSGLEPYRRTYDLNLSATPSQHFFISTSLQVVDDSAAGKANVADLAYRLQPTKIFKTEGKYTINSVDEEFSATTEAVSKQTGSFSFDLRPFELIRLRYLYKPNFTMILRSQTLSYNNEQQQAEINLAPTKYALLGLLYKLGRSFSVYNGDYPKYTVKDNSIDTDSTLYSLKMAPLQFLSTEFNFYRQQSLSSTLASTQEPYVYTRGTSGNGKFDAVVKTSLSEKFSIDTRYTFQKNDQGTGEATSDQVNNKSYTASLKGLWNYSDNWTFSLSGAYSRTTDYILAQVIYTFSPGIGFIYRLGDKLRTDFDYTYAKSFAGAETELNTYSLKIGYALSDFVNLNLQAEQEASRAPDYRLTDITGNIEINL